MDKLLRFYGPAFKTVADRLNMALARWASQKFKQLRGHKKRASHWLGWIAAHHPHPDHLAKVIRGVNFVNGIEDTNEKRIAA